ncbi:MAG: alcohol dehydrogenase, partial [Pseudomonadota bacterium]
LVASLGSLRQLGPHILGGTPTGRHETVPLPLLELVYARQLTLHGMRGLGASEFRPFLKLIETGRLDLAPLIVDRIALSGVQPVFEGMDSFATTGVHVVTRFDA